MAWQNRWHAPKSPVIRAFLLPKSRNISLKNEGWHWGVLRLFRELNPHKGGLWAPQKSKYKQILVLSTKNSIQSFGLGFSGFHEMWKHWNRVLFCFTENQVIENLSAICEPFLTASVTVREAAPPRAIEAAVSNFWTHKKRQENLPLFLIIKYYFLLFGFVSSMRMD